jgi:hypothetical protein
VIGDFLTIGQRSLADPDVRDLHRHVERLRTSAGTT